MLLSLRATRTTWLRLLPALAFILATALTPGFAPTPALAGVSPAAGDIIFNEFVSDNNAAQTDFFELLVLKDNLDLRGLRFSDNELLANGTLDINESVLVFSNDPFLDNVPRGTLIAIWTDATSVTTDTTVNPFSGDWSLTLAPGSGVTVGSDGLGGSVTSGLSTSGEALYLYLPGSDGTSAGTDNIYLDFISYKADGGNPPAGLTDINLPTPVDNAYYTGNTAAGNDLATSWVGSASLGAQTPGAPNPSQDLSALRVVPEAAPISASCGGPLNTTTGTATSRQLTASDPDSIVNNVTLVVSPQPAGGAITLTGTTPAAADGGTLNTTLSVSAQVPPGTYSTTLTFSNNENQTASCSVSVRVAAALVETRIHAIQGAAQTSPLSGTLVANVPGIVTAVRSNGFYLQDPQPDADEATSEGIFVFTSSAPSRAVGDSVVVTGTVLEFRPGGSGGANNLTTSEIGGSPQVTLVSSGNPLPAPVVVGSSGRVPPAIIDDDTTGSVEVTSTTTFDPANDAIDFYESLEGMLLRVNDALAVGPTASVGEIPIVPDNGASVPASSRTVRGGIVISPTLFNGQRIILDDALVANPPTVNVGDRFTAPITGVLDYSFSNFKLLNTQALPAVTSGGLTKETLSFSTGLTSELTVATFNVENLAPTNEITKFNALAAVIMGNLKAPDVIAVEEIQDNNGATNDAVVAADLTFTRLISAVVAAGGPTYAYRQINPADDQDGGEPGGNIRVGFLFNPARVSFVDRAGGSATAATSVLSDPDGPKLSFSPGRIDPANPAFSNSRKPLAGEFSFRGKKVFIIANHFNSKGGDQPLFGRFQPPARSSEVQRKQQAQIVNDFVDAILAIDPQANVIALGDINDFEFSEVVTTLEGGALTSLVKTLPKNERYSYNFEGNAQVLDHILVSQGLLEKTSGYDIVHVNSEFADQVSDHDPQVARFTLRELLRLPLVLRN